MKDDFANIPCFLSNLVNLQCNLPTLFLHKTGIEVIDQADSRTLHSGEDGGERAVDGRRERRKMPQCEYQGKRKSPIHEIMEDIWN